MRLSLLHILARGVEEIEVKTFDDETGQVITAMARDIRIEKYLSLIHIFKIPIGSSVL